MELPVCFCDNSLGKGMNLNVGWVLFDGEDGLTIDIWNQVSGRVGRPGFHKTGYESHWHR